jgi:hypothetical protein
MAQDMVVRMVNLNILSNLRRVGERPLFGIYAGVGIGILASVYIAMMPHDVRPLLCIPWLCLERLSKPLYDADSLIHRGECPLF